MIYDEHERIKDLRQQEEELNHKWLLEGTRINHDTAISGYDFIEEPPFHFQPHHLHVRHSIPMPGSTATDTMAYAKGGVGQDATTGKGQHHGRQGGHVQKGKQHGGGGKQKQKRGGSKGGGGSNAIGPKGLGNVPNLGNVPIPTQATATPSPILIVLVLGALGLGGWYWWHKAHLAKEQDKAQTEQNKEK